jgi:hypothetical protein
LCHGCLEIVGRRPNANLRLTLNAANRNGDLVLSGRGGHRVELKPSILRAFDNFLADGMSGHDLIYRLTLERMASAVR